MTSAQGTGATTAGGGRREKDAIPGYYPAIPR
jgi:hypothetical protein